jgi:transcriptional regulator with XRE-family HTH domain
VWENPFFGTSTQDMSQSISPTTPQATVVLSEQAGFRLKQIRERLGLTLRQVEEASLEIADAERNAEYVVSTARLNQVENDGSLPSIYKFYSLTVIYRLSIEEMMGLYGINLGKMEHHRHATLQSSTHLFTVEVGDPMRPVHFPVRFDPGFQPAKTAFLSRLIDLWGEVPAGLLTQLDLKKFRYGYIGLEDRMMVPILRPGSIVQVDDSRRRVMNSGWLTEYDRPIYFLELRYSYECCWCYQRGKEVTLLPHPLSPCGPRTIRIPDDGDVLGQIVGVAMRIVQ